MHVTLTWLHIVTIWLNFPYVNTKRLSRVIFNGLSKLFVIKQVRKGCMYCFFFFLLMNHFVHASRARRGSINLVKLYAGKPYFKDWLDKVLVCMNVSGVRAILVTR